MRDWTKINKGSISNNRALLLEFTKDFTKLLGPLNIGCKQCIGEAYDRLIKLKSNNMKLVNDCDYRLKAKYEGIFFKGTPIRNGDLTNKLAKKLLKNHKAGALLFDRMPTEEDKTNAPDSELKLKELRVKYPTVKANSKADFLEKVAALSSESNGEE